MTLLVGGVVVRLAKYQETLHDADEHWLRDVVPKQLSAQSLITCARDTAANHQIIKNPILAAIIDNHFKYS